MIWDAAIESREISFRSPDGRRWVTLSFGRAAGAHYCEVRSYPENEMHVIWLRETSEEALLGEIVSMVEREFPILDDSGQAAAAHA